MEQDSLTAEQLHLLVEKSMLNHTTPGVDFMKGLRLSPVSDRATGSNVSLLDQLSLCLKWFSQKEFQLRPSL